MRIEIHHYIHFGADTLSAIHRIERKLETMDASLQAKIDALTQAVQSENTVIDGAIALINGLGAQLAAAIQAAKDAGASPDQLTQLDSLVSAMSTESGSLSAAVAANTPAAPQP